jgi:uncharacterized membrane protein
VTDSPPADDDPVAATEAAMSEDDTNRVTNAVAGLAFCLVALQFTIIGVFDGSSFVAILAGLGVGGFGVVKTLNA